MTRADRRTLVGPPTHHTALRRFARVGAIALAVTTAAVATAAAQTPRPGGFPGGSGTLTNRSGSTLQIEGFAGTSKIIVTSSTEYRRTEDTDPSSITKGACIRVNGTGTTSDGITATSVTILDDAQACSARAEAGRSGGRFPGGGQPPNGGSLPNRGSLPNGGSLPNRGSLPNGGSFPPGATPGGGGVTGKVTTINGDSIVVTARLPKRSQDGDSNPNPNAQVKLKKQKVTVDVPATTTVRHTVDATESALVLGSCITAQGNADSVGTVTAETVTVSEPENGSCTQGFGGFGAPPAPSTT